MKPPADCQNMWVMHSTQDKQRLTRSATGRSHVADGMPTLLIWERCSSQRQTWCWQHVSDGDAQRGAGEEEAKVRAACFRLLQSS